MFHSEDRPLKLPLSSEIVENGGFLGPRFLGEVMPQISDIRFQIALTFEHVAGFGRVPFSKLGRMWIH